MRKIIVTLLSVLLLPIPNKGFADVLINGVKVRDDGNIVFTDNSAQGTATLQGPQGQIGPPGQQGSEGPKGVQGVPGPQCTGGAITNELISSICNLYCRVGGSYPSFCSGKDCVVGAWTDWGTCSQPCMGGTQSRTRPVIQYPCLGGTVCPDLTEVQPCNTAACPPGKIMFVTSQTFTGDLGGLSGADTKCQVAAQNAGLSGAFKAWLSDNTTSAKDRLMHSTVPYLRTDGYMIAYNWDGLTSSRLINLINCDENKICNISDFVFTATKQSGDTKYGMNLCFNWTSSAYYDTYFGYTASFELWTDADPSYIASCNQPMHLYCVQQ